MPLLVHPVPAPTARLLRAAVLELRQRERRKSFPPSLHLGRPGPGQVVFHPHHERRRRAAEDEPAEDAALRADVVAALLHRAGPDPLVWLARSGPLAWHDTDADWLAPSVRAFAEAGRPLTWVVVTRQGWWDPRGGARQVWQRLRARS